MKLTSPTLNDNERIPKQYAFGVIDPAQHATLGENKNPPLSWSDLPGGTKSLVLICHDPDVPTKPDDVNQEGKTVPADLPRMDFFHWILVDIPPDLAQIQEGEFAQGPVPKGKDGPGSLHETRQGINNYTHWFEGDPNMGGNYFGYDGPFPPWNDSIIHHYIFTLYALDVEKCSVEGTFTGQDVLAAIAQHTLAKDSFTVTYSLNPDVT